MEWRDYATPDERKELKKLDAIDASAVLARKQRRVIYNRCRKRMERSNG